MIQRGRNVLSPAGRLTVVFVLDVANISRIVGDVLDTVLLTAILQANQSAVRADPALQRRYAESEAALPDEDRRPISANALAQSLRLPFETVRRRATGLVAAGLCRATPAGLYVPRTMVTSPTYMHRQQARVGRLARFFEDMASAGLISPRPDLAARLSAQPRAADRLLGDYILRASDRLIRLTGNAHDGMVLLALWAAYSELAEATQPVSGAVVARSLGVSLETARRRLRTQEALGYAEKVPGGWLPTWARADEVDQVRAESLTDLRRLLTGLDALREPDRAPS